MEVHGFSKSLEARDPAFVWSLAAINPAFGLRGPAPSSFRRKKVSLT